MKNILYNIIAVSLILMMGIICSFSLTTLSAGGNDGNLSVIEEDQPLAENPSVPSADYNLGEDASAFERLNFALDMYNNGAGFTSIYTQICNVVGNKQHIYSKKYRGNGYNITEDWFKMEGLFSFAGKNEFVSYYADNKSVFERVQKNNYNFDTKTYSIDKNVNPSSYTVNEWEKVMKKIPVNNFFTTINSTTASVVSYDAKARGKDYYTIKLAVNPNKLDDSFLEIFRLATDSYEIKSITITFKIDKKTGYITSYEREDLYSGTVMNITGNAETKTKEVFLNMNVSAYPEIKNLAKQNFNLTV